MTVADSSISRPVRRMLVANRGEIASRIIEACRVLGIATVAVYAEADRQALFVHDADVAVALRGSTSTETYLDQVKLLDVALTQGCDAVHPGYGFLSENAEFARSVTEAGMTWIGPHAEAIARMGDKLAAKQLAAEIGVPTLTSVELTGDDDQAWRQAADLVGYPLLVKAAAGGGGRGMRVVSSDADLAQAVVSARREAEAAFGDGTVFAERCLPAPRHIEVQIVADRHGTVTHLGERECSIQRRHQKLIEEAPSPGVDELHRERLSVAAVALARAIDYDNVGTVEFLLDDASGEFFFLEMNTRIQVEHRVTEEVAGWDLVVTQIQSASGEALGEEAEDIDLHGHAIEARLYAEDPARDWLPMGGDVLRFDDDNADNDADYVVVDRAVGTGSTVSSEFDPLLAKIVAFGATRPKAIGRLVRYLRSLELHGIGTNRDYLLAVLEHPDFREGRTTTHFVADHPALLEAGPEPDTVAAHAVAAALGRAGLDRAGRPWPFAPDGWRNVGGPASRTDGFVCGDREVRVVTTPLADGELRFDIDGRTMGGRLLEAAPDHVLVEVEGVARGAFLHHVGDTWYVNSSSGQTDLVECPRFADAATAADAGGPTAPVPGRIVAVPVTVGEVVEAGQTLAVLEAMKVEHQIRSHRAAVVTEVLVAPGDTVDAHQLLIRLEEADHA